jgi:hypothetical protein
VGVRQAEAALQTGGVLWECWRSIATSRFGLPHRPAERDLRTAEFVGWLADHSSHTFQQAYGAVSAEAERLAAAPAALRHGERHAQRGMARADVAEALIRYYGEPARPDAFYALEVGGEMLRTSLLTRPEWLTAVPLDSSTERAELVREPTPPLRLDALGAAAAVRRLATVEGAGTVLVNNPLYRLVRVDIGPDSVSTAFGITSFARYALTADLLEEELTRALSGGADLHALPLRAGYLPDVASATSFGSRACVGGPLALTAIARRRRQGAPDYLLLVQQRSSTVLNVTGRLAVIPKAFHQPVGEPGGEVALSVTLERELEEELLGRPDLDQLDDDDGGQRVAPLHRQSTTEPLAWLLDRQAQGVYRTECTGFGINMVTGNYEFASLIVIDDETWWDNFGHLVASNWEAQRVHSVSSLDTAGLQDLATDPRWSNEGLFAFLQGLRRLADIDTAGRVAAPVLTPET